MSMNIIPKGWHYDHGDPSVGIFGDQWIHEDCEVLAGPGNTELKGCTEKSSQIGDPDEHGIARFLMTVDCLDCNSTAVFEYTDLILVEG